MSKEGRDRNSLILVGSVCLGQVENLWLLQDLLPAWLISGLAPFSTTSLSCPMMSKQTGHMLREEPEHKLALLLSSSSSPTFLSILSQATVSLIVYCSPKNQVSRSPRVRHTKSNRSFPFHFICNITNQEGNTLWAKGIICSHKNLFFALSTQIPKCGDDTKMADKHRIPK